jgi:WD40 repeat protein
VASGEPVRTLGDPCIGYHEPNLRDSGNTFCVAFSPDGKTLAAGGIYWPDFQMSEHWGTLRLWDAATGSLLYDLRCPDQVNSIAFAPDGKTLASAGSDGSVALWEVSTGRWLRNAASDDARLDCVAFSPDGLLIAACGRDWRGSHLPVKVWDLTTGALVASFSGHIGSATSLAFSADGTWLVSVGLDGGIYINDVPGE